MGESRLQAEKRAAGQRGTRGGAGPAALAETELSLGVGGNRKARDVVKPITRYDRPEAFSFDNWYFYVVIWEHVKRVGE